MDVDQDPASFAATNGPSGVSAHDQSELPFPDPPEPAVSALAWLRPRVIHLILIKCTRFAALGLRVLHSMLLRPIRSHCILVPARPVTVICRGLDEP